jgi:hypothetical protein
LTKASSGRLREIENQDTISYWILTHKFHDTHPGERMALALIPVEEEAMEAHMVEVIAEFHC